MHGEERDVGFAEEERVAVMLFKWVGHCTWRAEMNACERQRRAFKTGGNDL